MTATQDRARLEIARSRLTLLDATVPDPEERAMRRAALEATIAELEHTVATTVEPLADHDFPEGYVDYKSLAAGEDRD